MQRLPTTRQACTESIRELVSYDPWMVRWALFKALEGLDLHNLINLAQEVAEAFDTPEHRRQRRTELLQEERYRI